MGEEDSILSWLSANKTLISAIAVILGAVAAVIKKFFMDGGNSSQTQTSGDNSINIQAKGNIKNVEIHRK